MEELVADVFFFPRPAGFAHDVAAPDELTLALFLHIFDSGLVTSSAAQQRTAINSLTSQVANASPGAQDVQAAANAIVHPLKK